MNRGFLIGAAIAIFLGIGVIALASQSVFLFKHPKTEGVRVIIGQRGGAVVAPEYLNPAAFEESKSAPKLPRAYFPHKSFNFGIMNPLTEGKHEFVIQNVGTAPLLVDIESTTCKCTVGGLSKKEVEPGGETKVTLQWNTGRNLFFTHGAVIRTNDPLSNQTELVVEGKVRMLLGSDVSELIVPNMEPDQDQDAEFLLYSQLWEDFEVQDIRCGVADLRWQVIPHETTAAPHLAAKSVKRVRITIPGSLRSGAFADSLRIKARRIARDRSETPDQPADEAEARDEDEYQLALHGTVLRRFAWYGPAMRSDGVIDLGDIRHGKSKKFVLRGKIRDSERTLGEHSVRVTPDFIQATLTTRAGEDAANGLYELTLEVPGTAPLCQYLGTPEGELIIHTDHPRLGDLRHKLHVAITP
jgi:hypothetical protein